MCGVGGVVVAPGRVPDRAALDRLAGALTHRGPDGLEVEVDGCVGLVHTRLAVVAPGPEGRQPIGGSWRLSCNGEVFNHTALRAELAGVQWRGGSDMETLAEALAAWGEGALARVNGFFALAAVDRAHGRLLLARDRHGVKPLYWARHRGAVWFASEMRALLAAGIPPRAHAGVLEHGLRRAWANGPLTPLDGIRRIGPGALVTIDLRTLVATEREWFDPFGAVDHERASALARASHDELAFQLEDALRAGVTARLMADAPLGALCSGGVDSSLIAAYAVDERPRLPAFAAAIADQIGADESGWARTVARSLGLDLQVVPFTARDWRERLVETVSHVEHPLTHESSVVLAKVAIVARSHGMKALLSGEAADELFGGYASRHVREVASFARRPGGPRLAHLPAEAFWMRPGLGPLPAAAAEEAAWVARARRAYAHHRGARRELEALLASDLRTYLPYLLNRLDRSTMLASVEARTPFLDPGVVTLALNLPLEARVEPERKALLRTLGRRRLPPGVADRRKLGLKFDVVRYFAGARPDFLLEGRLREELSISRAAWSERVAAAARHPLLLWTAEIWCRAILDGEEPAAIAEVLWDDSAVRAAA